MTSLLRLVMAMIILSAGWTAILWFGIEPDFSKWTLTHLAAGHLLPALVFCMGWFVWRRAVQRKEAALTQSREEQAKAEREAALADARSKREEELRQRRFACDCRAVAISQLVTNGALELPDVDQVLFHPISVEQAHANNTSDNLLNALEPAIADALRHLYAKCAAASVFPLYVAPSSSVSVKEVFGMLRSIHRRVTDELALPIAFEEDTPSTHYLTISDCAADAIVNLFHANSDLPGAVILAFDSPLLRGPSTNDSTASGKPSHGVFALLVTHPQLSNMLGHFVDRESMASSSEAMTPFWEKGTQTPGYSGLLSMLPNPLVSELGRLPVLGRVHQGSSGQLSSMSAMPLTSLSKTLIGRAQVNACMADLPAVGETEEAPNQDKPASSCTWLVHNAGDVDTAGSRLAAIMTAMSYFGFDLHPFANVTNSIERIGDLNDATPIGMLALTIVHAAAQQKPVMCAEFSSSSRLSIGFVAPLPA